MKTIKLISLASLTVFLAGVITGCGLPSNISGVSTAVTTTNINNEDFSVLATDNPELKK